jgi:hypothetical protein
MVEEKNVEEGGTTLNVVIGLGGNGTLLVDSFARSLRSEPADLLVYACDTHDKCPEVEKFHKSVKYIPWPLPSEAQVKRMENINVKQSHIKRVKESTGEGVLRFRDYSRAAFYHNRESTIRKIREDVKKIGKGRSLERLKFILVTTLGGGTGSGSVIDFAESIRTVFGESTSRHTCIIDAFFVLPLAFIIEDRKGKIVDLTTEEDEDAFSNAFSGLMELREIMGDESRNPFRLINLISSYTLGEEWGSVDSVVNRLLNDFYREGFGEFGNLFSGFESDSGFITSIPAVVEFPVDLLEEYINVNKQIKELEKLREGDGVKLRNYTGREGEDEQKHGSLVKAARDLASRVTAGNKKIEKISSIEGGTWFAKSSRMGSNKRELKKIYEEVFGLNTDQWDKLVDKYLQISGNLAMLVGEDLEKEIAITKKFLNDGKAKGASTGKTILKGDVKGSLEVLLEEYERAWEISRKIKEIDENIESWIQREITLGGMLKNPKISGIIPVDEEWLNRFETGEISIRPYISGDMILHDLFKELKGDERAAEKFYVDQVNESLIELENRIKSGFYEKMIERGLEKFAYRGNKLGWKFVIASNERNYDFEPVKELINDTSEDIKRDLAIEDIELKRNPLPALNTSLRAYFIIGRMELNQFPEWEICKEKYLEKTKSLSDSEEVHAWGLEDGIWAKEHVEEIINEIESQKV